MPNDLWNCKKIFPDSTLAFKIFHYAKNLKKGIMTDVPIIETSLPDWFKFEKPDLAELKVCALGSEAYAAGLIDNLEIALQQKFLATINDFKNVEASWYLKFLSGTDPWCIAARTGGRPSPRRPCGGAGYRAYLRPDGACRFAKDVFTGNRHFFPPEDWLNVIPSLQPDQIIGMKFLCFNIDEDTKVKLELWLDELNQNDWKLKLSFTDTGDNWGTGATRCKCVNDRQPITWGGPIITFTCQGNSPGNTDYLFNNATVREINPGGTFAEATAGSTTAFARPGYAMVSVNGRQTVADTGGGVGDGAGGIADDTSTGTGDVSEHEPIFTIQPTSASASTGFPFPFPLQTGTTGTTSSPIGSPTTSTNETPTTGTNQRPERPLAAFYKDLGLMYNIVLDHSSACDVGNPFQIQLRQLYQTSGVETQEIKMWQGAGGIIRSGGKARSSLSVFVGEIIRQVTVPLRKFGNPTTGSIGCEIRDRSGQVMHTFPTTIDPAIIPVGAFGPTYTFLSEGNTYVMESGDMVLITINDTPGTTNWNSSNCIILKSTDKDEIDGFDTVQVSQAYNSSTYSVDQDKDMIATISV